MTHENSGLGAVSSGGWAWGEASEIYTGPNPYCLEYHNPSFCSSLHFPKCGTEGSTGPGFLSLIPAPALLGSYGCLCFAQGFSFSFAPKLGCILGFCLHVQ